MSERKKFTPSDFQGKLTTDDFMMSLFDPGMPLADVASKRLRHAMRDAYYSPSRLAKEMDMAEERILLIMLGAGDADEKFCKAAAPLLDVDVSWLFRGRDYGRGPLRDNQNPIGKRDPQCYGPKGWAAMICLFDALEEFGFRKRLNELRASTPDEWHEMNAEPIVRLAIIVADLLHHNDLLSAVRLASVGEPIND